MHALKYTSREVNRNFRIKVSGLGIHELKGFTGGKSSVSCPLKPSDSAPLC